jgi:hypothetical protein
MVRVVTEPEVRVPLQGGLPPAAGLTGAVVEIACDESGFSGGNMLDVATPLITHASVDLGVGEATEMLAELRAGDSSPVHELKSGQFLRDPRAGERLTWFGAALAGRAHVHLIDKEYFVVTRIVDLLTAEPSYAAGTSLTQSLRPAALALYRAGRGRGGLWDDFLASFVELVRTKRRHQQDRDLVDRFFHARDALARDSLGGPAVEVLQRLGRDHVSEVAVRLRHGDRRIPPPLEPLLAALTETILFWSRGGERRVLVVHDEQSALTADRLRRLQRVLASGGAAQEASAPAAGTPQLAMSPFAGLVMVDSRDDPRVQVADLLAGIARRFAPDGEPGAFEHLVSPTSLRDPEAAVLEDQ